MNLIAGEKLKKNDKLTIDKNNKAIKLKIGCVYIGVAPKNIELNEKFEIVIK